MPDWRDEAANAVAALLSTRASRASRSTWQEVGPARAVDDAGGYTVDLRNKRIGADDLDGLRLWHEPPTGDAGYRVIEVVQEGEALQLRVGAHVARADLRLWLLKRPPGFLWEKLRDRLNELTDPGLAEALVRGNLGSTPPRKEGSPLNPEQWQAYQACRLPGVRLVWGPPGTGKTMVMRWAIVDLVKAGKRVLLVSGTNIAVDNALLDVARDLGAAPGTLVRVGPPHLREIANDPDVSLPKLVAARCHEVEERRQSVERQLVALNQRAERLKRLEAELGGFDHAAYRAAFELVAHERRIADLARQVQELDAAEREARLRHSNAAVALAAAEAAVAEIEVPKRLLDEADRLERRLEQMDVDLGELHAEVTRCEADLIRAARALEQLDGAPLRERLRRAGERRRLRRAVDDAERKRDDLSARERDAAAKARRQRELLAPKIDGYRRQAAPIDGDEVDRRERALRSAREAAERAAQALDAAERALDGARDDLLAAEAGPRPSPEQRRFVAEADAARLPKRHEELERLRAEMTNAERDRGRLEREHEKLLEELEQHGRDAERKILQQARLVATTLARFRLHQTVYEGPYDVVLVDEVGAATIPEVLLAVAKARETAVLFGDFLQLGPVLDDGIRELGRPDVQRWLLRDCFGLCGVERPEDAEARDGCVTLTWQYRFGPDLMELANRATYAHRLDAGRELPARGEEDPEIILLDTDGLDDLGKVRRAGRVKGWWPAGSLLARLLAEKHLEDGTVGIVTPYRLQVEATLEALRDMEGARRPHTEVGTAHTVQGREFDTVIFDLVEDGGPGWVGSGKATGKPFEQAGARLFNVAATRARVRLYLICSRATVARAAHRGTVLGAVHALAEEGRIRVVRATELLTPTGSDPAVELDPLTQGLADTLSQFVRVMGIYDEQSFFQVLAGYLERARESICIWSPWMATRSESIHPLLAEATKRGVEVTIFTRPERSQPNQAFRERLQALRSVTPRVVAYYNMHQKIIVLDRQVTLLGSLNPLSHRDTREVMVELRGRQFAIRLLEHEHADHFANPPACGKCGAEAEVHRSEPASGGTRWIWRCPARACKWERDATPPEPNRAARPR